MINIEKVKDFVKENWWIDIVAITVLLIIFTLLFGNHVYETLTDRGRELLIPEQILKGHVPYKDITLIYFPSAYYINALIFKLFGISINTLLITQTTLCAILLGIFYLLAREFLNRKFSFLITILVLSTCVFCLNDLFGMINPYSYAMIYGIAGFWICTYSLVKLFRTDNIKFAYIGALAAGFSLSCKLEFLCSFILLIAGLLLYKKLKLNQYIKIFSIFCIFPLIFISIIIIQGVTVPDITRAINFALNFSKTPVMRKFLSEAGMFPFSYNIDYVKGMIENTVKLVELLAFCTLGMYFYKKYKKWYIIPISIIFIYSYCYDYEVMACYWRWLPIIIFFLIFKYCKQLYKEDRATLFVVIASLLLSQRQFFSLSLVIYGSYSLPLLILSLVIFINKFAPKNILGHQTKQVTVVSLIMLIILYCGGLLEHGIATSYPLKTEKGTFYTIRNDSRLLYTAIKYIQYAIDKNDTVLVLPEGNIINFATDRKLDLSLFMLDRLYYEAYGDKKSIELLGKTNPDYIVLLNFGLFNFYNPYLFEPESNNMVKYIYGNYSPVLDILGEANKRLLIMKKKSKLSNYKTFD